MAPNPSGSALTTLLAEETREVEAFVDLLRQEQALLASAGNADALAPHVERKYAAAARLKLLADKRENLLVAQGHETGSRGMAAWLTRNALALPVWQRLLALAAEARQINETNGKLIAIHWQHNQAALAALLAVTDRAVTYGPDGHPQSSGGGRPLGSA